MAADYAESINSVEVRNLTVKFGEFTAVDDVSFSVRRGEIFGFLGANGAGKTTTIRVLCGLLIPDQGEVQVAGVDLKADAEAIKRKVGYMSQRFTLYDDLTVRENLAFAAALRKISPEQLRLRTEELFGFTGFDRSVNSLVRDLPGGIKQQVSLIAALLHQPEIVFLDEPTSGVTPAARLRFWELIRSLSKNGKTVFVTTHYMDEADQCDRIALMRAGRISALDTPEGLKQSSFPEPIYELELPEGDHQAQAAQVAMLQKVNGVGRLQPHGMRFHFTLTHSGLEEGVRDLLPETAVLRRIKPSLEDVFIRVVEAREGGGEA
ncbi:MAG: ABC transporter [Bdellovibrionales bacterium GWB1_55_8]|nr:MAG: ABC transporter [Bdellovibrionales bacterium GWB1_55_8]